MAEGSNARSNATVVSAPGKVLLAGGYLVLDRAHTGLVFGLSARINAITQPLASDAEDDRINEVLVTSPQFEDAQWRYGYQVSDQAGGGIKVAQLRTGTLLVPNHFIEVTLSYVLTYVAQLSASGPTKIPSARVTVLADNDYYSHGQGTVTVSSGTRNPHNPHHPHGQHSPRTGRFQSFATSISDANKTGLGSSAALVTALVGSLLTFYLPGIFDIATNAGKHTLHNLAQAAHCAAQGKIGSGFDVAAAVYGSSIYRRFSPKVLADIPEPGASGFGDTLVSVVSSDWDTEIKTEGTATVPPGLILRMADVDCGTATVGMVKKVLAWKAMDPENSARVWGQLQEANDKLGLALRVGDTSGCGISSAIAEVRSLLREMGTAADVPIEPPSQTELIDAASKVEGVLGGVVPGAGGYDALVLVMRDDSATLERVKAFLGNWRRDKGLKVKLLDVKGEMDGARLEDVEGDAYRGWC